MFFEVTGLRRFPAALLLPDSRLQKFRVTGLHFMPHELPEIFVRATVEMLFRANLPHPTFVDQTIVTHGQGGIPDMLEVLLIVQFIQIALHGSVGCAGQLHRIGKNPVMGLFAAEFPCVVGLGVFEQHIPFPEAECSRGPGQPQQQLIFRLVAAGGLPQHLDVIGKIALIVCGVLVHNGFQRSDHIHIFKFLHGLHLQFL